MLNLRMLFCAIAAVGIAAPVSAGDRAPPEKVVDVEMVCNTFVGAFQVDPVAARAVLPEEYELALEPNLSALAFLTTSECDGAGNGEPLGSFGLADVWLAIDGPFVIDEVPGAWFTAATNNVYVLKAQTTSKWVKTHSAAIYFPKELVRSIDVGGPIAPLREGSVVEMTGRGYSWSEFFPCMAPPGSELGECWMFKGGGIELPIGFMEPPFMLGTNVLGYVDRSPGNGAKKEMQCLMEVYGQGFVQLQLDLKSNLAKLGIFQNGQVGYFWDAISDCHLIMSADR